MGSLTLLFSQLPSAALSFGGTDASESVLQPTRGRVLKKTLAVNSPDHYKVSQTFSPVARQ